MSVGPSITVTKRRDESRQADGERSIIVFPGFRKVIYIPATMKRFVGARNYHKPRQGAHKV